MVAATVYQFWRGKVFLGFLTIFLLLSVLITINNWRKRTKGADPP
jgi:hypothetical protein